MASRSRSALTLVGLMLAWLVARNLTRPRDVERWLERAGQLLLAGDYPRVIATAQRVLRAPIASPPPSPS